MFRLAGPFGLRIVAFFMIKAKTTAWAMATLSMEKRARPFFLVPFSFVLGWLEKEKVED